ncbi:MAG: hypothetical protein FWC78_07835 [Defluviitaleaceae bacterium]|nr:hypothetical protein [Defluviitaleaceae bacterium]
MPIGDIFSIVIAIVGGVGGIAAIFYAVVRFSANHIAERLSKKYELKLNKELENFKSGLEKKNYVSKVRFDAEFEIFRKLNLVFSKMRTETHNLFPIFGLKPVDKDELEKFENNIEKAVTDVIVIAQAELSGNAAFITEDLCNKFNNILKLCNRQLYDFQVSRGHISEINPADYNFINSSERTKEILEKHDELVKEIREYFYLLEVKNDD